MLNNITLRLTLKQKQTIQHYDIRYVTDDLVSGKGVNSIVKHIYSGINCCQNGV